MKGIPFARQLEADDFDWPNFQKLTDKINTSNDSTCIFL